MLKLKKGLIHVRRTIENRVAGDISLVGFVAGGGHPIGCSDSVVVLLSGKPLGSSGAWNRIGRRFALLGAGLVLTSVVVSLACLLFCQSRRVKLNRIYSERLSKSFEEYFVKNKDFTARMMDFAGRIEKGNSFLHNQIHIFAENLPQDERERLGKAWVAGGWGHAYYLPVMLLAI